MRLLYRFHEILVLYYRRFKDHQCGIHPEIARIILDAVGYLRGDNHTVTHAAVGRMPCPSGVNVYPLGQDPPPIGVELVKVLSSLIENAGGSIHAKEMIVVFDRKNICIQQHNLSVGESKVSVSAEAQGMKSGKEKRPVLPLVPARMRDKYRLHFDYMIKHQFQCRERAGGYLRRHKAGNIGSCLLFPQGVSLEERAG